MNSAPKVDLTERQLVVLDALAKRKPYKVIAAELSISETRVKQLVRALKGQFEVNSVSALVELFLELPADDRPYPSGECPQRELSAKLENPQSLNPDEQSVLTFADASPIKLAAPWTSKLEDQIVPGVLDGENASWSRLLVIVALTFGFFGTLILGLTAADSLSANLSDVHAAPVEKPK